MHIVSFVLLLLSAAPLPWTRGDVVWDGWKVTGIERHSEFLRYRMQRREKRTVVEITFKRSAKQTWTTRYFRVQPAPGYQPNYPLLRAMRRHLSTWEHKSNHRHLLVNVGFRRGGMFSWAGAGKLALGLLLIFGLFGIPPVKRGLGRVFGWWTRFAALLNPRPDRFGPKWVGRRTLGDGVAAFAVFAATTTTLLLCSSPPPLYVDTCVDLGLARDCADGVGCAFHGSSSSFMGLKHGALWTHFLAACRWLSWGPHDIHMAVTTLHGLAFGLFAWVLMGLVRRPTALLASTLLFGSLIALVEYPVLWNPTIVPITSVLFFASLVALLNSGRLIHAVGSSICLALVADAHMIHFLYVPVYLLAVSMVCRRPWWAVLLGGAAGVGVLWVVSEQSIVSNLAVLGAAGGVLPAMWALAAVFLLGLAWRDVYAALETPVLQFLLLVFVFLALLLVPVVIQRVAVSHPVIPRYLLPAIPLAVLLLARLARHLPGQWMLRRVSFVLVWCYALFWVLDLVNHLGPAKTYWSVAEVEALAGVLHRRGYSYEMVTRQLRGPEHQNVVKCLAVFMPTEPRKARATRPGDALYVTRLDWRAPPKGRVPGRELASLGDSSVALLRSLTSWVDVGCHAPCTFATVRPVSFYRRAKVSFPDGPVKEVSYPVVIRGHDPARRIRIVGLESQWRIVRVTGVRWSGKLPARQVVLLRSAQSTGTLTFRLRNTRSPSHVLPDFIELPVRSTESSAGP